MPEEIAVVGMECLYPGANNYLELWQNIRAGRKAFRRMPEVRLNKNYFSEHEDGIYQNHAAVIRNYQFDRLKFKIPEESYSSTDFTHWMALDIADKAISDVKGLVLECQLQDATGVFVGNTLTGEMTRSNLLRQRWPYVHENIKLELENQVWPAREKEDFLSKLEQRYKSAFPVMKEDSLAGGLSNTIAGRICNYFDFNGGGYTVDGACSSSLLAIATACKDIESGRLDMAIAGGVDISLDPFELVGFSRAGALARQTMKVFSEKSNGFWPGEGCGFVVLMNADLAREKGLSIYAFINGYGISSDGKGGLTRPKASMQEKAIRLAYPEQSLQRLRYIETHGTGTKIGDQTELTALSIVAKSSRKTVYLGALKELIGHTKAASGIAGFIKTVLVNREKMIPAQHTHIASHRIFEHEKQIEIPTRPVIIEDDLFTTGVSSFGFGGINVHVSLSNNPAYKSQVAPQPESAYRDCELLLFTANSLPELKTKVQEVAEHAGLFSVEELTDLSHDLFENRFDNASERLAVVTTSGEELANLLNRWLIGNIGLGDQTENLFYSNSSAPFRIGYLFPGQGTGKIVATDLYANSFKQLHPILEKFNSSVKKADLSNTAIMQPYLVQNSVIALEILNALGISAKVGIGHSLGELTALYWAGAISLETLSELTKKRGKLMQDYGNNQGRMYSVRADANRLRNLINGYKIVVACENSEAQTVISGDAQEMKNFEHVLENSHLPYSTLPVTRAFHSPLMESGIPHFEQFIKQLSIGEPVKKIFSPTTKSIPGKGDLRNLLVSQFNHPVKFMDSFRQVDMEVDVWIEVGSGKTMTKLARQLCDKPVFSTDISDSFCGLLNLTAFLFVNGLELNLEGIFNNRFFRPFVNPTKTEFIQNPCEKHTSVFDLTPLELDENGSELSFGKLNVDSPLEALLETVSHKVKLPTTAIDPNAKMLDDLHLNSIVVTNIIAEVGVNYGFAMAGNPTEYANASLLEISSALTKEDLKKTDYLPITYNHWVDLFQIEWKETDREHTGKGFNEFNWSTLEKNQVVELTRDDIGLWLFNCTAEQILKLVQELVENIKRQVPRRLLIIQDKPWLSGWVKSFFLENPDSNVLLIHVSDPSQVNSDLQDEWSNVSGFREIRLVNGTRMSPLLKRMDTTLPSHLMVNATDVVLVSGGAKGITFECALALAQSCKNKTVLMGRTSEEDSQIKKQVARFLNAELEVIYYSCDVTNIQALEFTIEEINKRWGKIDILLHGAGFNQPTLLQNITPDQIAATLAPKYFGLRNLLDCCGPDLKQVVGFGSIIAQTGMPGNADYAMANEWMSHLLTDWSREHDRRAVSIDWSVWSGTGMGDRLGVLEKLQQQGIDPISIEDGVTLFVKIVNSQLKGTIVVSGKFGELPTINTWRPNIPSERFLEDIKMFYPGREIVVEARLDPKTDIYLDDHLIDGVRVLPTVFSIEAMAQVASCLLESSKSNLHFSDLRLLRPIVIPDDGLTIQVRAFRSEEGIQLSIHTIQDLNTPFVQAKYELKKTAIPEVSDFEQLNTPKLDIKKDLYGELLFHRGRFVCITHYQHLQAKEAAAVVRPSSEPWYSEGFSQKMLTFDPAMNDAMLHVVQACVPQYTLLPSAIRKIFIRSDNPNFDKVSWRILAKENYRKDDIFNYTISLITEEGKVAVQFEGVEFHIVKQGIINSKKLAADLQKVALERMFLETKMNGIRLFINEELPPHDHRPDGKPIMLTNEHLSKSHKPAFDLAVQAKQPIACDVEFIEDRTTEIWNNMLGEYSRTGVFNSHEDARISYTRMWGIKECFRKIGMLNSMPVKLVKEDASGYITLSSPGFQILSYLTHNIDHELPSVITIVRQQPDKIPPFEYSHTVSFEETNLVGNVYFTNYVKWQGLCREAFLHQKAMQITNESGVKEPITNLLSDGRLALVTCSTSCNYFREFKAFDRVKIKMTLDGVEDNRIKMKFEYYHDMEEGEKLMAEGSQEVACMERTADGNVQVFKNRIPLELKMALEPYMD